MRRATAVPRGERGFTLVELLVVMLVAGVVAASVLALYGGVVRSAADQGARITNQDSARLAVYEMSRLIRGACSSDSNLTSVSDSLHRAGPKELVFFTDLDGDESAERVRYYLSGTTLRMQTAQADTSENPPVYPAAYDTDGVVILDGIRNGAAALFTYFGFDEDAVSLYGIAAPDSDPLRRSVVAVGIRLLVNEQPEIARGGVELSTRVLIRQRYDGGLGGS